MPANGTIERRNIPCPCGIEFRGEGKPEAIVGHAAVFYDGTDGTQYRMWDDMVERIMPGAFDKAIREDDVRALVNHDPSQVLGRNTSGSLKLSVTQKGLRFEVVPPDTQVGRDTMTVLRRGDVTGASFAFVPTSVTWRQEGDLEVREVVDVRLYDISVVTYPAYQAADSGLRSEDRERMRQEAAAFMRKSVPDYTLKARSQKILADIC